MGFNATPAHPSVALLCLPVGLLIFVAIALILAL